MGSLDALVVDLAPGSDRLPASCSGCAPRGGARGHDPDRGGAARRRALAAARARGAGPLLGLVENFASVVCSPCGAEGPLFREASTDAIAAQLDLAVLARIPFDARAAAAADAGRPLTDAADGVFDKLAEETMQRATRGAAR